MTHQQSAPWDLDFASLKNNIHFAPRKMSNYPADTDLFPQGDVHVVASGRPRRPPRGGSNCFSRPPLLWHPDIPQWRRGPVPVIIHRREFPWNKPSIWKNPPIYGDPHVLYSTNRHLRCHSSEPLHLVDLFSLSRSNHHWNNTSVCQISDKTFHLIS